ncbi:MAG: hypothetical protein JW798_02080 [Prolixibacteraceae bacterium]|nr:hypothetical protein [Prolixibacteraceae bacterium]
MTMYRPNWLQYSDNRFMYNGKELQDDGFKPDENGNNKYQLDWYDYWARFYDPALGRFHTVDPLAELFNYQSPFAYAANNPVRFIDYLGLGYYDPELGYVSDDVDVTYYQPFDWTAQYLLENTQTQNNGSEFRGPGPVLTEPIDLGGLPESENVRENVDIYDCSNLALNFVNGMVFTADVQLIDKSIDFLKTCQGTSKEISLVGRAGTNLYRIGVGTSVTSGILSLYKYSTIKNPTWGNKTELGIGLTSATLSAIPQTTYLGIGIGLIDVAGGFNGLYYFMDMNEILYKQHNMLLIPRSDGFFMPISFK